MYRVSRAGNFSDASSIHMRYLFEEWLSDRPHRAVIETQVVRTEESVGAIERGQAVTKPWTFSKVKAS